MYGMDGGSIFGAIVSLSSLSALPSGHPGSPFDTTPLATVIFNLPIYQDAVDIPGQASYFAWFNNQWGNAASQIRFVVYGNVIPEPHTLTLLAAASGAIALWKWRPPKR